MTKEERRLWYDFLKQLPVTVNRQKVIGHYIVDFYCASAKLAIELDGSQHYEDEGAAADRERDHALNQRGITIVRYSNNDVNRNFDKEFASVRTGSCTGHRPVRLHIQVSALIRAPKRTHPNGWVLFGAREET